MLKYKKIVIYAVVSLLVIFGVGGTYQYYHKKYLFKKVRADFSDFKNILSSSYETDSWPGVVELQNKSAIKVNYTFNDNLTKFIKRLLKRYRSDYSAVVVIDNNSGKILSAIGHERQKNQFSKYLPFSSTHPSASIFKIITAAELIENTSIENDSMFDFVGRGKTLYKYQLKEKKSKWSRAQSLKKAFAYSNNVIFGKAAIYNSNGTDLFKMANSFGFNGDLLRELNHGVSTFYMPEDQYNFAELASGFNRKTQMSPLHAAVIASIIANGGVMKTPYIVEDATTVKSGKKFWLPKRDEKRVINSVTSNSLQSMMELAVKRGTARGGFRKASSLLRKRLKVGGKTGSITGGIPKGKRDWFSVYAFPGQMNSNDRGISVGIMNINVDKWYVKSSYLAKEIIEFYFKKIDPLNDKIKDKVKRSMSASDKVKLENSKV